MAMKFDEINENDLFLTDSYKVTKEDIMSFASVYDPLYIHIDEERAKEGFFGEIIASGLHGLSITWKLWIELDVIGDDAIGGVGIDNVKFIRPIYANDVLSVQAKIINKQEHINKSDRGYFTIQLKTYNQSEQLVLKADVTGLIKRA